jgi:ABC-type polysaccharide/polyol phosphate transport system ATPase subunit
MPQQSVPAIVVDGVSKTFALPHERVHTLKEKALHPLRRSSHETLRALRDVSFAVQKGEFFGIVGRNGSGKSTLLKCLAGIYATDDGRIYVNGRVSTFIELGVGFNPDLPARDNVMINATMLGLTPREARRRFDRIVDFAELHDFVDLKLKNYSSGMLVRLAFSVMIQVDAEILLIDEVLAVGDAAFQQKCFEEFVRIRRSGATVLLVTHDMGAVQRFCDRAMLLEHGRRVELGEPERVGMRYMQLNFDPDARAEEETEAQAAEGRSSGPAETETEPEPSADGAAEMRLGDGLATILESWFEDEDGHRTTVLSTGRPCRFRSRVRFAAALQDPLFGVNIHNSSGDHVWGANNLYGEKSGSFEVGEEIVFEFTFRNLLAPDRYFASPAVANGAGGIAWHDHRIRFASVMVTGTRSADGLVELPFEITIQRGVGGSAAEQPVQPAAEETAR